MPVREIKTSLALDGEKAFKQAIADASRQLRVMNADLKAVAAEFDLAGDKEQMLTQKSGILKTEISQQEKIVEALNRAVQESAEAFGDSSNKTDGYRIKLSNAKASLSKLKSELQDADREAEEFGRDSVKVGRQIEDGIGDSAEDAEKSVKGLIERMSEDIGAIKGSAAFTVTTNIMGSVVDAVQGLLGFVEENRDYRRQMSYLQEAAKTAGKDWVDVQEFLFQIASLTGNMDGAFEAISNLLKTGLDNAGIQNAIDLFTGAGILWGDTFSIENLAESFQESVATGEATGAYAELIERLGKDVESYNELMKDKNEIERAYGSLTFISNSSLIPTAEEYKQNHNELIEAQRAQIELTQAWAELAEELEPTVTALYKYAAFVVDNFKGIVEKANEFVDELPLTEEQKEILENEKNWVERPIVGGPAGTGLLESFGIGLWELTKSNIERLYQKSEGTTTPLPSLFEDQNLEVTITPTPTEDPEVNEAFEGLGASNGASYDQGLNAAMSSAIENAKISGVNVGVSIGNGITEATPGVVSAAVAMVNRVNEAFAGLTGGINLGVGGYTAGNLTANFNIDGRRFGQYTSPIISNYLGQSASRTQKIG